MPKINGKIYYNNVTGDVLVIVNQNEGVWIRETTFAQDVATYPQLSGINDDIISVMTLRWGQHAEDFLTQRAVKVVDGVIKWQPSDMPEKSEPDKPFSEKLDDLQHDRDDLATRMQDLEDMLVFMTMP